MVYVAISIVAPSQSTLDGLHMIFGFAISFLPWLIPEHITFKVNFHIYGIT